MQVGVQPAARSASIAASSASGRIASDASVGINRSAASPKPAMRASCTMLEWISSDA